MKESTHKLKEKFVGVDAHIDPHFKGIPKNNKGITLIALIITIIVMMILVAVTVTFTIGENGILAQAKESAKLAERAQLHEQIMGAMKLTNEGKIKIGESYTAAKEMLLMQDYEVGDLQADGTFEVTGKKGTYKYKITETEITVEENVKEEIEDDTLDEEIVWAYIDWGEYYSLLYVGADEELEITEDREVKAYVGKLNEDTEEKEYNTEEITSVRLSEIEEIEIGESVKKLVVGQVIKGAYITPSYSSNPWELVISGDYGDIPEYGFEEKNIEKVVIEEGVTTVGQRAFIKNELASVTIPESVTTIGESAFPNWTNEKENVINYGGTEQQWKDIEMNINSVFGTIERNAKVVLANGTEIPLFPTTE